MTVTLAFCALLAGQAEVASSPPFPNGPRNPGSHAARSADGSPAFPATLRDLRPWGVRFRGAEREIQELRRDLSLWLARDVRWNDNLVEMVAGPGGSLDVRFRSRPWETDTLHLAERRDLGLVDDSLTFRNRAGAVVTTPLVSRKEVLAAILQRGRLTEFPTGCCSLAALQDHIAVRQNIVRWSLQSDWDFPYSGFSVFNREKWTDDHCVRPEVAAHEAVADFFTGPQRYVIGCRTSCKVQVMQGLLDFARREDPALLGRLENLSGNDPLGDVQPRYGGRNGDEIIQPGKFVDAIPGVAWDNWVPGDWGYIKNTDPVSSRVNGDEGKNTIYIGRGLFAPNYRSEEDAAARDRPLERVLYYVYSWRSADKIEPRSPGLVRLLAETPEYGGLLEHQRFVPRLWPRLDVESQRIGFLPQLRTSHTPRAPFRAPRR